MRILGLTAFFLLACTETDKADDPVDTGGDAPVAVDADSDGYDSDEDCNDSDATINPGAPELCGGL